MSYRYYDLETELHFGKFIGQTLEEILEKEPSYIIWCLMNLDHFLIERELIVYCESRFPGFVLNSVQREKLEEKLENADNYFDSLNFHGPYSDDSYDPGTFGEFEGSYAQDEMGFSDEDIYIVFEGDPEAYWNID